MRFHLLVHRQNKHRPKNAPMRVHRFLLGRGLVSGFASALVRQKGLCGLP